MSTASTASQDTIFVKLGNQNPMVAPEHIFPPPSEKLRYLLHYSAPEILVQMHRDTNQTKETFSHYHKYKESSFGATTVSYGTFPGTAE